MENSRMLDRNLGMIAWGLLLIWWGIRWSILISLPDGAGLLGTGAILLGINALRSIYGLPTKSRTTWLGVLSLIMGGLLLILEMIGVPLEIQLLEALLIALGIILVFSGLQTDNTHLPGV